MAVHQQDVRADGVAADFDVLRETGEDPDAAAAVEAVSGLKVHRGADELIDELERLDVLNDAVPFADDSKYLAGVLADVGPPTGDLFAAGQPPVVDGGGGATVDRDRFAFDAPTEVGVLDRFCDRRRRLIEYGAEAVPRGFADGEHRVAGCDSCGHDYSL